ncbi:MAG: 5-deoxy-glucuronate isomerase [Bifidobacteriaceae bacterium]|jgi:5-deoxy-glucuronate isomerase|nr:5-deoxy-glucuronate isomerase [Bifidobacteriaceae bacterium]
MANWYYPKGSAALEGWTTVIDSATEGWEHTGLKVAELSQGQTLSLPAGPVERVVLPLSGAFTVLPDGGDGIVLAGRPSVWTGPSDTAYVGPGQGLRLSGEGRVAVCEAAATEARPATHQPASAVPVELRGAGACSREVRNFGTPGTLAAQSIIACEVITPAGNWSSYPPHKHDEELEGVETALEEIYYFQMRSIAQGQGAPLAYQRVSASPGREIDVLAEVHDGDVVLVPFGWHGPSMAAPGYDLYYLNIMAGPGRERAWRTVDHPDHAWIRQTLEGQSLDPRLPFGV